MRWNPSMMHDLNQHVVVVTGANTGLGFEVARTCAAQGATVVLACRSVPRGKAAMQRIRSTHPNADLRLQPLDLGSLESVRQASDALRATHPTIDVLVNNAAIMASPYGKTVDGFERQMGINHLGHFAFTLQLLDPLLAAKQARIVTVGSYAHHSANSLDFDNLMFEDGKGYTEIGAYARSKLANLLFHYELNRRLTAMGSRAMAVAAHPGVAATELARHWEERWYFMFLRPFLRLWLQTPQMGSWPTLRALGDPSANAGDYFGPAHFLESRGVPVRVRPSRLALDAKTAHRLWDMSETLTSIKWTPNSVAVVA